MTQTHSLTRWMAALGIGILLPIGAGAQATCEVRSANVCVAGGTSATSITITVTEATRVTMASSSVSLPAPTESSYNTGFGGPGSVQFEVRSNTNWAVAISSSATAWTGSPLSARQDKPATDLQWSLNSGGPFTDVTSSLATISTGAATASTLRTLFLRSKYAWATDRPGSYTIQVQIVLTAP